MASHMRTRIVAGVAAAAITFTGLAPAASAGILDALGHGLSISAGSDDDYQPVSSQQHKHNTPVAGDAFDQPNITTTYVDGEPAPVAGTPSPVNTWPDERTEHISTEIARIINEHRAEKGEPPMRLDASMSKGAQVWAEEMARLNFFNHDPSTRMGEIIALHRLPPNDDTSLRFVLQWENSEPHRVLMHRKDFHVMGVGYAYDQKHRTSYAVVRLYFD